MVGDVDDMAARMRALLPRGWFADSTPMLGALLRGLGAAWSFVYALIQFVIQQARISTATGLFLDMISVDFFGGWLPRLGAEADDLFRSRIRDELMRARGTRSAVIIGLLQLTGRAPTVFEPSLPSDAGGYSVGGVGYAVAGGWGNLALPFQMFITAYRPLGSGIPLLAGYGSGGIPVYGSLDQEPAQIRDSDINRAIARLLPVATVAWTRITG